MTCRFLAAAALLLVLAPAARAGGPAMALGATEDAVRAPDLVSTKARLTSLRLAGFTSVRVTSQWLPGQLAPPEPELQILRKVAAAAQLSGVAVYLSVYPPGSRATPYVKDAIVGNEPNLNPLLDAAVQPERLRRRRPAYLALLARTYDAVKWANPTVRVWGGALAPRGIERAGSARDTHSPVSSSVTWAPPTARASGRNR